MSSEADITKDKIMVVIGGIIPFMSKLQRFTDFGPMWLTMVPAEEDEEEKARYPRNNYIRLIPDICVGTVAELVKDYEDKLTKTFNTMKNKLHSMHECIERNDVAPVDSVMARGMQLTRQEFAARMARRQELFDSPELSVDAYEADVLERTVGFYDARCSTDNFLPASPSRVQRLIDRLIAYKQDLEKLQ